MAEAAAKEPSMEDILSSIRKIIADEGKPAGPDTGSMPQQQAAPQPQEQAAPQETERPPSPAAPQEGAGSLGSSPEPIASNGTVREAATRIAAQETEMRVAPPPVERAPMPRAEAPSGGAETTKSPGSLASIAEAVKSRAAEDRAAEMAAPAVASPRIETSQEAAAPRPTVAPFSPDTGVAEASPVSAEPQNPRPVAIEPEANTAGNAPASAEARPINEVRMADAVPAPEAEESKPEVAAALPAGSVASTTKPEEAGSSEDEAAAFKGALMSPSAGGAVTGAFDRLKRSTMDDMDAKTEAILRPMLREWLDENLPTLVERLVREEIERVARGN